MSSFTAVILAGGIGKRFTPFVSDKTLFPFFGESLLERTIRMLADAGVQKVIVASNSTNHDWLKQEAPQRLPDLPQVQSILKVGTLESHVQ